METQKNTPNPDEMPLSPEEIKAIGEIELGPAKHEIFLNKHYKKLIIGGIAFMVAASAAIGYYSYTEQQQESAGALIVTAMGSASQNGAAEPSAYVATALATINNEYPDTNSAELAQLMEALSLLTDNAKAEMAIGQLESIAATTQNPLLRARTLASLATHFTNEEQTEKATGYWKQIIAQPANPYTALAYLTLGDLAKQSGDIEGARTYYNQLQSICPYSPLVRENVVGLRLALLDVDAPKPVAAPAAEQPAAEPAPAPAPTPAPSTGNPFGIDPSNPFGDTPTPAPATGDSADPFGGMSTLPGGAN